ncbi:MAG: hypothetical protein JSV51_03875 [Candidatus Bathyarchaeota archaeon]|nr:MAG: hypothetical protein JSV51_03875 [Candidatus Bathyarchaeota archaeon]
MSDLKKRERTELYKDHLVQALISKLVSGEISRLEPSFNSKHEYRYPLVETIVGDQAKVEKLLNELTSAGILTRELHDKVLFCPHCSSPKISTHYNCPHCKSFNISKSALIEHIPCGYIDTEDHFEKKGKLLCPRCRKELVKPDADYRKAGIWCTCNDCNKSFDIPVPSHLCRDCNKRFTFEDAHYRTTYSYELGAKAKQEAPLDWVLTTPIREFLENHGFEVEAPGFLKGKSGAKHVFDIVAFKSEDSKCTTVIDLATSPEDAVSEQPIIAMFAKTYDVSPKKACLIAIPKITANGKKMAKLYNIGVIEAKNPEDAIDVLENAYIRKEKRVSCK